MSDMTSGVVESTYLLLDMMDEEVSGNTVAVVGGVMTVVIKVGLEGFGVAVDEVVEDVFDGDKGDVVVVGDGKMRFLAVEVFVDIEAEERDKDNSRLAEEYEARSVIAG